MFACATPAGANAAPAAAPATAAHFAVPRTASPTDRRSCVPMASTVLFARPPLRGAGIRVALRGSDSRHILSNDSDSEEVAGFHPIESPTSERTFGHEEADRGHRYGATASRASMSPAMIVRTWSVMCRTGQSHQASANRRSTSVSS